jgi:FtsH-binding integral membrane protein
MNPLLITGTIIVTCALAAYSIAVITEQRKNKLSGFVLLFLTAGITLDITATCFMIAGSRHIPITFHGVLGYSALAAMLTDTIFVWKSRLKGAVSLSRRLHLYTRFAYLWWVIAYFAGGIVAMFVVAKK